MAQIISQLNSECESSVDSCLQKLKIGCLLPILLRNESCSHSSMKSGTNVDIRFVDLL
jgi:hypothetical protein